MMSTTQTLGNDLSELSSASVNFRGADEAAARSDDSDYDLSGLLSCIFKFASIGFNLFAAIVGTGVVGGRSVSV